MTTVDTAAAAPPSYRWARVGLVLVAAIELLDALSGVQGIFTDYHHDTALLRFAQGLTSIKLALSPLLAGVALLLAARGNIRYAVFALAALTLAGWLLDSLPAIVIHGFKPSFDFGGIEEFFFYLVMPIVAVAAIVLATKRQRLGLAALLACLPALYKWASVAVFFVMLLMYGFYGRSTSRHLITSRTAVQMAAVPLVVKTIFCAYAKLFMAALLTLTGESFG